MHSTNLRSSAFRFSSAGRSVTLLDVFPGLDERDRLGVIVRTPCGAVGASSLILATVTAFYDVQRARSTGFFIYPDYFLFHVGRSLGDHNMLDIWPPHKEIVVEDDPETILRAINDRAITRLLLQDVEFGLPLLEPVTLASARSRIATVLAYSPTGRVRNASLSVSGTDVTESYVLAVLDQSLAIEPGVRARIRALRATLFEDAVPVESYRYLTFEEAIRMLAPPRPVPGDESAMPTDEG